MPKEYTGFGTNPNDGTTWSSATLSNGSNLAGLFDGDLSTNAQQSTNGTAASISNFGPITVASTVSFYSPDGDARYTLNGGSEVSKSGAGWHDLSFSGSLTSFTFQAPGNARIFIYGMKVDGVPLLDGARDNSFHLNFSDSSTNEALGFDSAPTIPDLDPKKGMDVITYTGNGGTQNIGGLNFEPGLVWIKARGDAYDHHLYDSIRGTTKALFSNRTNAEIHTQTDLHHSIPMDLL